MMFIRGDSRVGPNRRRSATSTRPPGLTPVRWTLGLRFLAAGAVAAILGACEETTPTATAPPAPPPPAQPQPAPPPPSVPTGLQVSATTTNSITWTWTAVEGATAYEVQVSADEVFDDTDAILTATETSHTVTGLSPESGRHLRVRAVAGTAESRVVSAWSSHVIGMSAMPPLTVGFGAASLELAEGETVEIPIHYLVRALTSPLSLRVSPILITTETDDFVLPSMSVEIPAGENTSGTTTLSFTAQPDLSISEGEETVSLRFVASPEADAKLGDPIEIRIKEAGAVPCNGVTVAALSPAPSDDLPDHFVTTLAVDRAAHAAGTRLDFLRPYWSGGYYEPVPAARVGGWRVENVGDLVRHEVSIDWTQALEDPKLRIGFVGGRCLGTPIVTCSSTGCSLAPG